MSQLINDFVINIATINGSGSQTANTILLKSFFRMGLPVGAKNFFPSNIQGMPTWFRIRVNQNGFTGHHPKSDILINLNPKTLSQDIALLASGALFIYDQDMLMDGLDLSHLTTFAIPYKKLIQDLNIPIKYRKFTLSMVYVGFLSELLKIESEILQQAVQDHFEKNLNAVELNIKAISAGANYYRENYSAFISPFQCKTITTSKKRVLMDGNTAAGMGLVYGGCHFVSWYPITPSTSVVESFKNLVIPNSQDSDSKPVIIQAEDELSAICMVLGAGWSGARALTATSGPGLSLMAEASGYAFYAEIPAVIWDVQRVGPSTGLPTRTAQGDLLFAHFLSHGDSRHVCLIPGNLKESFEFAQTCFDLAETLQTLVIVLSDLDLGMNIWAEEKWNYPTSNYQRGQIISKQQLDAGAVFERYNDLNKDGIPARTLPGTHHEKAAYFTRGSGHDLKANYTENPQAYRQVLDRLDRKWETARTLVPKPIISTSKNSVGIIYFGPLDEVVSEAQYLLKNISFDTCRVRALPFNNDIKKFLETHKTIYVIDQNQTAQMKALLSIEFTELATHLKSIRNYDGQPLSASILVKAIQEDSNDHTTI
ncbi:MAG: 2-oxoacid:acceptor oxidoreductase subunit alpha [Pseudobdellovibrio sp.]